jgi:hypothetical protein
MRVEILEERLSSEDSTGRHHLLGKGDIVTVPDDTGAEWCSNGWAKDIAGAVATGERRTDGATVTPTNAKHASAVRTRGGRNG